MDKLFDIAGAIVRLTGLDGDIFEYPGRLAAFATDADCWQQELHFHIADQLPEPQGECVFADPGRRVYKNGEDHISYIGAVAGSLDGAYIWKKRNKNVGTVLVKRSALVHRISTKVVLMAMEIEHLAVAGDGFLLHASCICHNGRAIVFTAPSGTGKSTQAALWERLRNAEVINGDRIMIQQMAHGFDVVGIPFSGSSGICINRRIPLAAIVCLSQGNDTVIEKLSGFRAFRLLWEGCSVHTWDRSDVAHCSETVQAAVDRVPILHMTCTPDEAAVFALEDALERLQ